MTNIQRTLFTQYAITGTGKNNTELVLEEIIKPRLTKFKKELQYKDILEEEKQKLLEKELQVAKDKRISIISKCRNGKFKDDQLLIDAKKDTILHCNGSCNSRLCPHCVEKLRKAYFQEVKSIVLQYRQPRFLTLSFANPDNLTREYLQQCAQDFNLMRKKLKKRGYKLNDYVNVLEIKFNQRGDGVYHSKKVNGHWKKELVGHYIKKSWNVHNHVIFDGDYIPINEITEVMREVTKGKSYYATIEFIGKDAVQNPAKVASYISKYITKSIIHTDSLGIMLEYYKATDKIRFVKIVGIKSDNLSYWESLKSYYKQEGADWLESTWMWLDTLYTMTLFGFKYYDQDKTLEENYCKYINKW